MAYEFILRNKLTFQNLKAAHAILIANLLPATQQGLLRTNPMIVINWEDRIDDVAAEPSKLDVELHKLFADIELLLEIDLSHDEVL